MVQRLIILGADTITAKDLREDLSSQDVKDSVLMPLRDMEKQHILKVLDAVGGNKTKAAEILQIDRKTLRTKLE